MAVWGGGFCHRFSSVVVGMGAGRWGYRWHLKPPVGNPCHALSTRATTFYNPQKWVFTFIFKHLYLPIVNTAIAAHQTDHHKLCSALWLSVEVEFSFQMTGLCTLIIIFMLQICFWGYLHLNFNQPHSEAVVSSLFCCWLKFLMWQGGDDLPVLSSTHFLTRWGGDDLPVMLSTHEKKVVISFIHFITQWEGDHLSVHLNFF